MMLSGRDIQGAIAGGVSFVCANCEKFWWGVDRGLAQCRASYERKDCGGPITNLAYPEYEGPLNGQLVSFCFQTGNRATCVVRTAGGMVGASAQSVELLRTHSRFAVRPMFVTGKKLDVLK
jgi:hypothetical protein